MGVIGLITQFCRTSVGKRPNPAGPLVGGKPLDGGSGPSHVDDVDSRLSFSSQLLGSSWLSRASGSWSTHHTTAPARPCTPRVR